MPPRPFRIDVPQAVLTDLHRRLDATRFPEPLPGAPWERGADVSYIRELCSHWRHQYDWRRHEAELNRFPQFLCEVDGVDLHFWHVQGKGPSPMPLLLTHGWPGSIYEFHHLIGSLTDPAAHGGDARDAFDVVIPALPGYGFSGKPREPGWNAARVAAAFDRLMVEHLGYSRYGAQGGDWGGLVTTALGVEHAEHLVGIHLNLALAGPPPGEEQGELAQAYGQKMAAIMAAETGYFQVQSTKPMSLAIAQSDSPAGLAAWIIEKFQTWSDCGGQLERVLSKDWLLTNLMFYWVTNSAASAANLYYETHGVGRADSSRPVRVPTAVAVFPKEIPLPPRRWLEARYNLRRYSEMAQGGHFAAVDAPDLFLADVRAFFRELR
ncbi:epoxide hydrolase family protein [Cystobacter ferrugineus]|uniref:Multidrug MFS transporter n=1 Tax=Cystobacter ferrugineus TaxID=83449 RepID=A0A1L9B8R8_9BACT|nr:epoxide hydrolase family protein [Cystobacter ferrugineus]OJH38631.1 multidrug MFS transporter [Cystobacter ferrugineus]